MDISRLSHKIVFVTGFQKNCGKTTTLNYLIQNIKDSPKGYFSIGMETGKMDSISSDLKPHILGRKGDIILSNNSCFFSDSSCKIINSYNNGETLMLEVLRDGYVPLVGVGENFKISSVIEDIKARKCKTIFIDGSFDRITQVSAIKNSHFIYVARVEPDNIESVSERINLIFSMSKVPVISENLDVFNKMEKDSLYNNGNILIKGAITASKLEKINIKEAKNIFFEDFTKIFLDYPRWENLKNWKKIYFCSRFYLAGFVINLRNVLKQDFEAKLKDKEILKYLNYNLYEHK